MNYNFSKTTNNLHSDRTLKNKNSQTLHNTIFARKNSLKIVLSDKEEDIKFIV
jgi:hypothetical protein